MTAVDVVGTTRNRVGESPLWAPAEAALYWVDIEGRRLHRRAWADGAEQQWDTDERLACIALHANGGLLAGMDSGLFHLRPGANGQLACERIHTTIWPRDGMRFNDGRCDRAGRFWVTSMVRDMSLAAPAGSLFRCDSSGLSAPQVDGLVTGNGLAFSPDGRTLYLSDSHPQVQRVWAFDLDERGQLSRRRPFIDFRSQAGRPDGAAVDAEGAYWICGNDGGAVHRFMPDGRLDRSITLPAPKPSMCSFGGPLLDHLFITSIAPPQAVAGYDAALDGALFVTRPGVCGLAEQPFIA